MSPGRFASLEIGGQGQESPNAAAPAAGAAPSPDARHFIAAEKDAVAYLAEARECELAGDAEGALRSCSAALGENPLLLEGWTGQLWALLELGEFREAQLWADKAMERFPEQPDLLALKAVALYRMGHEHEARGLSDAALARRGETALVWLCRGELMLADSRPAAEECFGHALRLVAAGDPTVLRIAAVCLRYGKYSLALATLQPATAALPRAAVVWYLLGRAQTELGLTQPAQVSFAQAAELAPANQAYRDAARRRPGLGQRFTGCLRRWLGR